MGAKKTYHHGNLRLMLLETAAEMISSEGLKKLTLRELSQRVGVSRTAPYRHFANKNSLLFAIAEEGFKKLTQRYRKMNRNKSLSSLSRLQNNGLAYIEFAVKNPGTYRLMFGHEITQQKRSPELHAAAKETFDEFLIAVEAFQKENKIKSDDIIILANFLWATVHGLATLLIDGHIQLTNGNHGMPTLLTNEIAKSVDSVPSMIAFSKKTLIDFWLMISNGYSIK